MTELSELGVAQLGECYGRGDASPTDAVEAALSRIAAIDDTIGAFVHVAGDEARVTAEVRAEELRRGLSRGPLHGVPVAVKELFDVAGAPGSYGSDVLADRRVDVDAPVVARLRRAGAIVVGTTRSHEFGWGLTTQHVARGGTRNPWDLDRIPGGSSGGSAAAVAAGMVPAAVASDTGGSIRLPASFCGISGIKPTFGRIGRTGGVALAPSLDTPGVLARNLADAWLLLAAMSGADADDAATTDARLPPAPDVETSLAGMRVGVAPALVELPPTASIRKVHDHVLTVVGELGADIVEVDLPGAAHIRATFGPIQMAEAYDVHHTDLGLYPDRAEQYGPDVRSRLEAACDVGLSTYLAAQRERLRITRAFEQCLAGLDVLLTPTSSVGPCPVEDPDTARYDGETRPLRDAAMGFTTPQNLTGLPTAVIPAGFDDQHMPVGVQATAARWGEDVAVRVGNAVHLALGQTAPVTPVG